MSSSVSWFAGSSHRSQSFGARTTGIRLWIDESIRLAVVVTIVKLRITCSVSG